MQAQQLRFRSRKKKVGIFSELAAMISCWVVLLTWMVEDTSKTEIVARIDNEGKERAQMEAAETGKLKSMEGIMRRGATQRKDIIEDQKQEWKLFPAVTCCEIP